MRRLLPLVLLVLGGAGVLSHAEALTSPIAGAVSLPAGADMRLPFPAGARVRVLSGYGPSAGSSLHADTNDCCKANDHYALDLDYADEASGGLGMPLLAPLDGTVVKAGWATAGWANYGLRVILRHDLGDGHVYHTLYAHMNAIDPAVTEGSTVTQGQVLGELGRSCGGALSCGSFSSPHLHFAMHRDSSVGGSGTGGSYGGNAVVPEPFDGYEDLSRGDVLTSTNGESPECGDGSCNGGETSESCPGDCPACAGVPAAGRVVDESEVCFERRGSPEYWYRAVGGHDGGLWWTHTTDSASADDHAFWRLTFDEAGEYRVEAYTDGAWAQSTRAGYVVRHEGAEETVRLDQSAVDGWNEVGVFRFAAGGDQWIRLDDNTGEPFSGRTQIVFDALRLTRTDVAPETDAGTPDADGGTPPATDGGTSPRPDGSTAATDGGPDAMRRPPGAVDSGCGCTTAPPTDAPRGLLSLLLPALLLLLRRPTRLKSAACRASARRRGSRST